MKRLFPLSGMTSAIALAGSAHAATEISASMSLGAYAEVGGFVATDTSTDAWSTPLSSLGIGATATADDGNGHWASSFGYGNAGWSSPNAGSVSFEGYGFSAMAFGAASAAVTLSKSLPDWIYTFAAGVGDARLDMAYDVVAGGNTFGLWGWSIVVEGGPEGTQARYASDPYDPTAHGVFHATLTPGQTYSVSLVNNANLSNPDAGFDWDGSMSGNFRWQITPVPEPGTYALMGLGLLLVAGPARRRRG